MQGFAIAKPAVTACDFQSRAVAQIIDTAPQTFACEPPLRRRGQVGTLRRNVFVERVEGGRIEHDREPSGIYESRRTPRQKKGGPFDRAAL